MIFFSTDIFQFLPTFIFSTDFDSDSNGNPRKNKGEMNKGRPFCQKSY